MHDRRNEEKTDLKMSKKASSSQTESNLQRSNDISLKKRYNKKGKKGFLSGNPGRPVGSGYVSTYMNHLSAPSKIADWVNKEIAAGNEKVIISTHLALVGKFGAIPTEDKERNPFDLGPTETVTDIKNALNRVIQAEAAGEITHAEADAFEKRLATMFTYIQAAAHESIQTISHLSTTEAFGILEKRNTEIKSLEKIN